MDHVKKTSDIELGRHLQCSQDWKIWKDQHVDTADMANFRPVSNLTFMSKVTERAVARQVHEYLAAEDLLPHCQSAYRKQDSTETAMLRPPIVRPVHCRLEQGHSQ